MNRRQALWRPWIRADAAGPTGCAVSIFIFEEVETGGAYKKTGDMEKAKAFAESARVADPDIFAPRVQRSRIRSNRTTHKAAKVRKRSKLNKKVAKRNKASKVRKQKSLKKKAAQKNNTAKVKKQRKPKKKAVEKKQTR